MWRPLQRLRVTSVHATLTIALACTLSVVVGGFGGLWMARERAHRLAELDARTGRLTHLMSRALSIPVWNVDAASIRTLLDSVRPNIEVVSVSVGIDNSLSLTMPMRGQVTTGDDAFTRTRAIEYQENERAQPQHIGELSIVFTRHPVSQAVRETRNAWLVTLVALLTSLCAVNYLLIRRIVLDPIQRLAVAMDGFAAGATAIRCRSDSQGELGHLAARFNAMADRLVESTATLRDRHDQLEVLVCERTHELAEAKDRAESASRAKSSFLANMSHELRTPLNAVMGFSQLIRSEAGERLATQDLQRLDLIHRAGRHLLTLINDVLDVARIEAGRIHVDLGAVDVAPLLDEALHMSSHLARQTGIAVNATAVDPSVAAVLADPLRLRQVVINLLSNAIKYNRPGGSVQLTLSRQGDTVSIEVCDTGLGMTREQLLHLYEPFNRLGRERGGIDGSGIGLALTRQLVRLMRGELEITSEVGRGTCAKVTLPHALLAAGRERAAGAVQESPARRAPGLAEAHPGAAPAGLVLYIEDNPVNAILVEQMLAPWKGVRFEHAVDGASGVERARALQPDLVLLDMQLTDMTGADVLRLLDEDPSTQALRVIAVSASAMPEDVQHARECGAIEYWTKPLDFKRFLADMARMLAPVAERAAPVPAARTAASK
jgi:signal transduction histidine kinase/CheY-like chemotaxis protein